MLSRMLTLGHLISLLLTFSLLHCVSTQAITFSDSDGNVITSTINLSEQEAAHQICLNINESPTGSDLVVTITPMISGSLSENDFELPERAFTFMVGTSELRQCFDLTLNLDNLLEQREFLQLTATSSSSSASLLVFILDADVLEVGLDQLNYSVSEESGSVQICVVALPGAPTFDDNTVPGVQIDIATSVDTAEGDDFIIPESSVTLSSTTTSTGECVTITGVSDMLVEGVETLSVTITSPTARGSIGSGRGTAVVSIMDDEAATIAFEEATITTDEGDNGMMTAVQVCVVISLTGDTLARNVEAQVTMNGGTANSGEDFSLGSTTVTFAAESSVSGSTQCLDVMVIGDSDYESDETATFDLSTTSFAQLGTMNSVTITIRNDDPPPPATMPPVTTSSVTTSSVTSVTTMPPVTTSPVTTSSGSRPVPPSTAAVVDNTNRNIGIGVGVGIGGFLIILVVVVIIVAVIIAVRNKQNSEKYVLNYSTVYGSGSDNAYSSAPATNTLDGGESGANGINERPVDVGEDANDESGTLTFKEQ